MTPNDSVRLIKIPSSIAEIKGRKVAVFDQNECFFRFSTFRSPPELEYSCEGLFFWHHVDHHQNSWSWKDGMFIRSGEGKRSWKQLKMASKRPFLSFFAIQSLVRSQSNAWAYTERSEESSQWDLSNQVGESPRSRVIQEGWFIFDLFS